MEGEQRFGPPTTLEEENKLVLARSEYMLKHITEQEEQMGIDHLTRAKNLKFFTKELEKSLNEISGKRKKEKVLKEIALIAMDIDHFKDINDTYGHSVGDDVLKKIVSTLKKLIREEDVVARVGGEEFMVLLPTANMDFAIEIAEEFRVAIEKLKFNTSPDLPELKVTASFGVVSSGISNDATTLKDEADKALYEAKNAGRNRVVEYKKQ
jgi:diguanylate cyclase (GGDEF)-like protein